MKTRRVLLLGVVLLGLCVPVLATRAAGRRSVPPRVDGGPKSLELYTFARHLRVGEGVRYQHLTLYPVSAPGVRIPDVTLTLDLAGAKGLIEVAELKESEVNRLTLRSRAKEPIFVMAGEMVRGGKQDRIMTDDLLLAPGDTLSVAVYCVEHGRWSEGRGGGAFSTGHSLAGSGARGGGMRGGQSAVWDSVAEQQRALKAPSATGALRSVHDSESVRHQIGPYRKAFAHFPEENRKASGLIAVADGEILAADLFSSSVVFRENWPELLEAYAIDAVEHGEERDYDGHRRALPAEEMQHWLEGLTTAGVYERSTPGEGDLYELRGPRLQGTALVWDQGVVHVGLFPAAKEVPEEPQYSPLQFRRDRLQHR